MNTALSLREAADAVEQVVASSPFPRALEYIGPDVVLTGIGKSYLTCLRAAATMRSYGIRAWSESATDLLHGGLGCNPTSLIAVSHSGETEEVLRVVELAPWRTVAITCDITNTLARKADVTLAYGNIQELEITCGLPIAVNYVQAGILDALTLAVANRRRVTPDTVAHWHPGGALGRKLNDGH